MLPAYLTSARRGRASPFSADAQMNLETFMPARSRWITFTVAPGGDVVRYSIELDNGLDLWGLSLNVKYFF